LNYDIPIDDYNFNLHAAPLEGNVSIYPGYDTVYVNCEDVAGNNLIVYAPPQDYVGSDRFEIEYCPPNDSCEIIKIDVNVLEESSDTVCPCAATSCVWPGDTDNNGKVNSKDILPIGYYLGETGPARNFATNNWLGLNSTEWNNSQIDNGYNLNHVDADGNGIINTQDTISVIGQYNKVHNLYPSHAVQETEFPLYLQTDQTSVDSGEVLTFDIIAGDEDYPAKEINGISYTLSLQNYFVDSASLHHEFYSNSWLTNGGTSIQFSKQVQTGQVESALSRIGFPNVSGIGKIATCDFIVEDDIDGLKRSTGVNSIPITVKLTDIVVMNGDGTYTVLPDAETTVMLNINSEEKPLAKNNVLIYPNPVKQELNVFLNGKEKISGYTIFNSLGKVMDNKAVNKANNLKIHLNSYNNGVYFIKIYTDNKKTYTKKIEILN
ncbi:MAG TPA: T9SS type A sorting domain-containing protein, partial [Bacteroidetes bacterium]|nr:T9SS type A sorting domain-containing protein [Bacteroidota bacterium]